MMEQKVNEVQTQYPDMTQSLIRDVLRFNKDNEPTMSVFEELVGGGTRPCDTDRQQLLRRLQVGTSNIHLSPCDMSTFIRQDLIDRGLTLELPNGQWVWADYHFNQEECALLPHDRAASFVSLTSVSLRDGTFSLLRSTVAADIHALRRSLIPCEDKCLLFTPDHALPLIVSPHTMYVHGRAELDDEVPVVSSVGYTHKNHLFFVESILSQHESKEIRTLRLRVQNVLDGSQKIYLLASRRSVDEDDWAELIDEVTPVAVSPNSTLRMHVSDSLVVITASCESHCSLWTVPHSELSSGPSCSQIIAAEGRVPLSHVMDVAFLRSSNSGVLLALLTNAHFSESEYIRGGDCLRAGGSLEGDRMWPASDQSPEGVFPSVSFISFFPSKGQVKACLASPCEPGTVSLLACDSAVVAVSRGCWPELDSVNQAKGRGLNTSSPVAASPASISLISVGQQTKQWTAPSTMWLSSPSLLKHNNKNFLFVSALTVTQQSDFDAEMYVFDCADLEKGPAVVVRPSDSSKLTLGFGSDKAIWLSS